MAIQNALNLTTTGLVAASGAGVFTGRTITGTVDKVDVSNGDGTGGNPTLTIATTYAGGSSIVTVGTIASGTWEGTTIAVNQGGTGATTLTDGGILLGSGTSAITALGQATNGQLVIGSTGADPVVATPGSSDSTITWTLGAGTLTAQARAATDSATGVIEIATDAETNTGTATDRCTTPANITAWTGSTNIATVGTITSGTWNAGVITATYGGTGLATITDHGVMVGSGTGAITPLAVGTNGQLLIGSTGADPVFGTVTAGTGLTSTLGAGTFQLDLDTPVTVANGGSGRTSHTAYAVLCGGTTTTAAQQSIASVGTSGQVLTSNGAAALPTFQAAGGGGGKFIQEVYTSTASVVTINSTIPTDDTIPQKTEGIEVLTLAITPTNASSYLTIQFDCGYGDNGAGNAVSAVALFVDATSNAIAARGYWIQNQTNGVGGAMSLTHRVSAGSTSARTYKIRVGVTSGTVYINGITSGRAYGGVQLATLSIREITP